MSTSKTVSSVDVVQLDGHPRVLLRPDLIERVPGDVHVQVELLTEVAHDVDEVATVVVDADDGLLERATQPLVAFEIGGGRRHRRQRDEHERSDRASRMEEGALHVLELPGGKPGVSEQTASVTGYAAGRVPAPFQADNCQLKADTLSPMQRPRAGGGWPAIWYAIRKSHQAGGLLRMYRALRSRNACKTCALGMGGQRGGMVNEAGKFPEVCKKSIQAMAADMQGAIREHFFDDFTLEKLQGFTPRELEASGRITEPLYAGPLDQNYRAIGWDEAIEKIAGKLDATAPEESFFYFSGRSSNEAGFLLQLVARMTGTNNVNNCSYYCHQASGVGLSSVTGSGTATIELEDVDGCDLLVLIGANPSSNHPRLMRTLIELRRRGGKIIVINPLREIGLERFRVPSDVRSLLFSSKIADLYVQPHIGGDIALLAGVTKAIIERDAIDHDFVTRHAEGWEQVADHLGSMSWEQIVSGSGVERDVIERVADLYAASQRTIFCWAMGITHHEHGVQNVQAIANLAIARGMLGKPSAGLLPLRGHSNVQGIGSMGVTPTLKQAVFDGLERTFGITLPTTPGLDTLACMERAHEGTMRFACCLGGNLYGSNPDAKFAAEALQQIDTVVYLSTTLNTGHAWGRGRETIILPVLARDEETQQTTQESMFNYVRLSDGGISRFEGPRSEVDVIASIAERVLPQAPVDWASMRQHGRIREAIGKIIPGYAAIGAVDDGGGEFQIEGRIFHEPSFPTESGRAICHVVGLPPLTASGDNELRLMTVRSEGQFNTVVYEDYDLYRGQERRDVIMMNPADIARLGVKVDQAVTVATDTGRLEGMLVREIDIPPGNAVMYYPTRRTRSSPSSPTPSRAHRRSRTRPSASRPNRAPRRAPASRHAAAARASGRAAPCHRSDRPGSSSSRCWRRRCAAPSCRSRGRARRTCRAPPSRVERPSPCPARESRRPSRR